MGFGSQAVDGSCCGNVQSPVVLVAPGEICRLLRQNDRSKIVAVRVPQPDPLRACHKNISPQIQFHAIWDTIALAYGFGSENLSRGQRCTRCEISSKRAGYGPDNLDYIQNADEFPSLLVLGRESPSLGRSASCQEAGRLEFSRRA